MEDNLLVGSNSFTQPREFDLLQVEKITSQIRKAVFIFNFGCYYCKITISPWKVVNEGHFLYFLGKAVNPCLSRNNTVTYMVVVM